MNDVAVVYWLLDDAEQIIYVGMTGNIKQRLDQHSRLQPWWPEVASVATGAPMRRAEAAERESADIVEFQPRHNAADRFGYTAIQMARTCWSAMSRRAA